MGRHRLAASDPGGSMWLKWALQSRPESHRKIQDTQRRIGWLRQPCWLGQTLVGLGVHLSREARPEIRSSRLLGRPLLSQAAETPHTPAREGSEYPRPELATGARFSTSAGWVATRAKWECT